MENVGWILGFLTLTIIAVYLYVTYHPSIERFEVSKLSLIRCAMEGGVVRLSLSDERLNFESGGNWLKVKLSNKTIYEGSIGRVTMDGVGCEFGGIWRENMMIIPPDFHYKGNTLILSIKKITNNFSVGGRGDVTLRINRSYQKVFPNSLKNPINETLEFELKSDFYRAWARFLMSKGIGVKVDDSRKTVKFTLPPDLSGTPIPIKDVEDGLELYGKIDDFKLHLEGLRPDFNLPIVIDSNQYELVIQMKKTGGGCNVSYIVVAFIDKVNGFYETWRSKYPIPWNDSNLSLDLTSDEVVMVYTDQLKGVVVYDLQGDFANPSVTWGEYVNSTDYGDFVKGDENYLCDVFSHYLSLLPKEISIEKPTDPKYKGFDKLHSWIRFEGEFFKCIKFLYITEYRISVGS